MTRYRLLIFILLIGLLISNLNFAGAESTQDCFEHFYAAPLVEKVNIRAGQSPNFEILTSLEEEDLVLVIGEKYGWYKVRLTDQALSYVHKDYIKDELVAADKLRVRAGAGTNFNVLGMLKEGERVNVLGKEGDWLRIAPPDSCSGWIKKDYLKATDKKIVIKEVTLAPEPLNQENKTKASGVVKRTSLFSRKGKYKLVKDKKTLYYIISDSIALKKYLGKKVSIIGELKKVEKSKYPFVNVEQLMLLEE